MDHAYLEELCKSLRLSHIPKVIDTDGFDSKEDWLLFLLKNELRSREEAKTIRLYKQSKLPCRRPLSTYEWHNQISLPSPTTKEELTSLSFIKQCQNAVFVGTPGTGYKSQLKNPDLSHLRFPTFSWGKLVFNSIRRPCYINEIRMM